LDWGAHIVIAVTVAILIITFIGSVVIIHDVSMETTLHEGNRVIIDKISPRIGNLQRGDVVVIKMNDPKLIPKEKDPIIKRIVAVEGDSVEIKDGKLIVNDVPQKENYVDPGKLTEPRDEQFTNLTVQPGYIYVMGDNRPGSSDSRYFGPVETKKVVGKAIFRFWPLNKFGLIRK
jgi:signal peptidase I